MQDQNAEVGIEIDLNIAVDVISVRDVSLAAPEKRFLPGRDREFARVDESIEWQISCTADTDTRLPASARE